MVVWLWCHSPVYRWSLFYCTVTLATSLFNTCKNLLKIISKVPAIVLFHRIRQVCVCVCVIWVSIQTHSNVGVSINPLFFRQQDLKMIWTTLPVVIHVYNVLRTQCFQNRTSQTNRLLLEANRYVCVHVCVCSLLMLSSSLWHVTVVGRVFWGE